MERTRHDIAYRHRDIQRQDAESIANWDEGPQKKAKIDRINRLDIKTKMDRASLATLSHVVKLETGRWRV